MRLVIPDKDVNNTIYTDEELQSFLEIEGSWRCGAALALETASTDDLIVLKLIRVKDIEVVNVDRASALLLKRAQTLRAQAASDDEDAGFDVIPIVYDEFTYRQRIRDSIIREG